MKKLMLSMVMVGFVLADCSSFQRSVTMNFDAVARGELPVGWIVSCSGKSFPGIWEVNDKKQLYIKYPRANRFEEKNIFFTKDYYFTNGSCEAKLLGKSNGGVIFRARDRKNYYAVTLDFKHNELIAEEIENKKAHEILRKPLKLANKPTRLKVAFCNDEAIIYLDGKRVAQLTHLKKRAGGVGVVASGGSQAVFDDILIKVAE